MQKKYKLNTERTVNYTVPTVNPTCCRCKKKKADVIENKLYYCAKCKLRDLGVK